MYAERWLSRLGAKLDGLWPMPALARRFYAREFAGNADRNLFRGRYGSFAEAQADAPESRPLGYDNEASTNLYSERIRPHDYPALYWIRQAIDAGAREVFDLGGHTGVKFFAYRRLGALPATLRWMVCEVPAVAEAGRRRAAEEGVAEQLRFTTDRSALASADVFYASGAVQYIEESPGALLQRTGLRPRWIVLNTAAIHPTTSFITLNSIGTAFCPYRVQSRHELVAELEALGYRRRDEWENVGKGLDLPGHPELQVPAYKGFCFELSSSVEAPAA